MFLPFTDKQIHALGAEHTVKEIMQQARLWKETYENILNQREHAQAFFSKLVTKHEYVRFIFTGAGTSAFVGDTLVPYLRKINQNPHWTFEAIATTDLVSSPSSFLREDIPTVLVSFARSGNSPESVAAVELGAELIKDYYQIIITCNETGHLANTASSDPNALLLLMPRESNDLGFAMTSSFSCMMLGGLLVFQHEKLAELKPVVDSVADGAEKFLSSLSPQLEGIFNFQFDRITYLGSGILGGIARESALKILELTAGKTVSMYETPLGFRHGPKSIMNDQSLIVLYMSQDPYTRKYDLDLLKEVYNSGLDSKVVVLDAVCDSVVKEHSDWYITVVQEGLEDIFLGFVYITFAQSLAVKKSIELGIQTDNPSENGLLNRVVQGVTIYPLIPNS